MTADRVKLCDLADGPLNLMDRFHVVVGDVIEQHTAIGVEAWHDQLGRTMIRASGGNIYPRERCFHEYRSAAGCLVDYWKRTRAGYTKQIREMTAEIKRLESEATQPTE
jgi:hypothetical protein